MGDEACASALAEEALLRWEQGSFHAARVGVGDESRSDPSIRKDHILWLPPAHQPTAESPTSPALHQYLGKLEVLREAINRQTWLGLFEWEGHMAIYPPDSFYQRHLDATHMNTSKNVRERMTS